VAYEEAAGGLIRTHTRYIAHSGVLVLHDAGSRFSYMLWVELALYSRSEILRPTSELLLVNLAIQEVANEEAQKGETRRRKKTKEEGETARRTESEIQQATSSELVCY